MASTAEQARFVFDEWHRAIMARDVSALTNLYAPNGQFESPAIFTLTGEKTGILQGREAIHAYYETFFARLTVKVATWWRRGDYFFDGKSTLVWEYPRETPEGEQNDIVEWIELDGALIAHHRVFWGWIGLKNLQAARSEGSQR